MRKIKKYDKLIDHKISEFNINIIKRSIGKAGTIDKQSFWKLKKILAPRNKEIPLSILDRHDNLLTDSINIKNEYRTEFQCRLRKREIRSDLKWYESFQNHLCQLRIKACRSSISPNFSLDEVKHSVGEPKLGRSADPTGMVREIFKKFGDGLLYSLVEMVNTIKASKNRLSDWNKIWIRTLKKRKGTFRKLNNYRGIFLVPILSIIFEKLLKNRISDTLQQNISKFQNGGMKGKGVVDNLFILRGIIDHANYLGKELWLTFYDIEKCFDSLWLEDCINPLWDLGVKNDVLCLIYLMNIKATVTLKTPFGDTDPLFLSNFVKQGTVLGPVLNNCSLNKLSTDSIGYNFGSVQIKSMEFVDDLADPNRDKQSAQASNAVL